MQHVFNSDKKALQLTCWTLLDDLAQAFGASLHWHRNQPFM